MMYDDLTPEALIEKAEQLEQSGRLTQALEVWRAAAEREPDPEVLCEFASLAMKLERWSDAEEALIKALQIAPVLPNPYTFLGSLYFKRDMLQKAVNCYQKSLAIELSASVLTLLSVCQLELGLTEDGRASLDQAISINPNYEEAYYNLGLVYRETEPSRSIDLFAKAVTLDPEYAEAHRELGWALNGFEGKDAEAEYHIRRAIEFEVDDGWAHIYLGNILWQREDLNSAEQSFKKAVEVWSDIAVPYWCLALFYERVGRTDDATCLYQRGVTVEPDDIQANKLFGIYLNDLGETAKARTHLERALAGDPEDKNLVALLANIV
jgi:tetratricopeptide (TPR) repeat protein